MLKRMIRNNLRRPLYSIAIVLFAAVLTLVLCFLHQSAQEELQSYEETYASVPVTFRVTALDGSKPKVIPGWIADLFTDRGMQPNLEPYVGKLYSRVSYIGTYKATATDETGATIEYDRSINVAGIGGLYVAEELTENWGGETHWFEGYDESILITKEHVCLVPEEMKDLQQIELRFSHIYPITEYKTGERTATRTFTVVGYYIDKGNSRLYCPYGTMTELCAELGASKDIEEVCALLNDNNALPQLREAAPLWFAEPNPSGAVTPWGRFDMDYYPYALDIDDYMLRNLESNLKNSLQLNQLASVVVFVLAAGAGFLTGFLVIRSRKREIALMRTMGASHPAIFIQLMLEQMMCLVSGILLGGAAFLWQPLQRLGLFGGIYFAGLSIALVIFLCKNLLTTIKEDE